MAFRIQLRRDTAAQWEINNPLLLQGEAGYETDTRYLKVGDGITYWNDLNYFVGMTGPIGNTGPVGSTGATGVINVTGTGFLKGLNSTIVYDDSTYITAAITSLGGLTGPIQTFATGTSGTDFGIISSGTSHTFNLPIASGTNTGKLSSSDWTTFNSKQNALINPVTGTGASGYLSKFIGTSSIGQSSLYDNGTTIALGTTGPTSAYLLQVNGGIASTVGINLDTNPASKTGIYSGVNQFAFFGGNNQMASYGLVGNVPGSYFHHSIGFNNSAGASGTQNAWRVSAYVIDTGANTSIHNQILIDPQYNHGAFSTALVRGIYYNPNITNLNGAPHVSIQTEKGDALFGTTNGYVGIGPGFNPATGPSGDMPQRPLHVKDIMRLEPRVSFPAGASAGDIMMYTDGTNNTDLYYYGATAGIGGWRKVSFA